MTYDADTIAFLMRKTHTEKLRAQRFQHEAMDAFQYEQLVPRWHRGLTVRALYARARRATDRWFALDQMSRRARGLL